MGGLPIVPHVERYHSTIFRFERQGYSLSGKDIRLESGALPRIVISVHARVVNGRRMNFDKIVQLRKRNCAGLGAQIDAALPAQERNMRQQTIRTMALATGVAAFAAIAPASAADIKMAFFASPRVG